jgi:hypothetical protein
LPADQTVLKAFAWHSIRAFFPFVTGFPPLSRFVSGEAVAAIPAFHLTECIASVTRKAIPIVTLFRSLHTAVPAENGCRKNARPAELGIITLLSLIPLRKERLEGSSPEEI